MKPTIPWMKQKFAEYNKKYFGGKLPLPKFEVKPMMDMWGKYDLNARYRNSDRKIVQINDTGVLTLTSAFQRNEKDVISTLLHEMCHEYLYLVEKIFPKNMHGVEFMSVAANINADGWKIESETIEKTSDVYDESDNGVAILAIFNNPNGTYYRWWICKADESNMNMFLAMATKNPNVGKISFYKINTSAMEHVKSDPSTLFGWGGMSYGEAAGKLASYCGIDQNILLPKNLQRF